MQYPYKILTIYTFILFQLILASTTFAKIFSEGKYSVSVLPAAAWIKKSTLPKHYQQIASNNGVKYLLKEDQFNFSRKEKQIYQRIQLKITSAGGLKKAAKISVQFNPAFEKLIFNSIDILRNGKRLSKLDGNKIKLIQQEKEINNGIYSGYITALLFLEDVRVDDIIDYSYTISGSNPVLGSKKFSSFSLNYNVDIAQVYARIIYNSENKLYLTYHFLNNKLMPAKHQNGNEIELIWSKKNVKSANVEDRLPSWYNPYDTVYFSEYKNWKQISSWANSLYDFSYDKKKLNLILKSLKLNGMNDKQKTSKILQFVQDKIRYLGIELGQNSHRPHLPDEVLNKRYGDCKDKSLLMVALLKEENIEAYPALVSSYRGLKLNEIQPSPSAFDHVITSVVLDGKTYWLDATALHQRGDLDKIAFFNYYNALLIKPGQTHLTKITPPNNIQSSINVTEQITLNSLKKPAQLMINSHYEGIQAEILRSRIENSNKEEFSRYYYNYYAKLYPGIEISEPIKITDDIKNNLISIKESYEINQFLKSENNEVFFDTYAVSIYDYIQAPKLVERKMPLVSSYPTKIKHEINITLPKTILWNKSKDKENINSHNIKFKRLISSENNKVSLIYEFQPLREYINPKESRAYIQNLSKIERSLSRTIYLPDPNISNVSERTKKLKKLARDLLKDF